MNDKVVTFKKNKDMKRFFVNGKEISEKEAKEIEANNKKYMESNDFNLWAKCEFVTVIGKIVATGWQKCHL